MRALWVQMCMGPVVSGKGRFLGLTHHLLLLQSFRTIFHTDPLASRGGVYIGIFLCIWCFAYIYICISSVGLMPTEVRRCQIPRNCSYMVSHLIWMLGIQPGPCGRAVSVANDRIISPPSMEFCFRGAVQYSMRLCSQYHFLALWPWVCHLL